MQVKSVSRRVAGAIGMLALATGAAHAGAFAIREQSAFGQGASFAGIAAGGAPSSMFWNPATITQFRGIVSEQVFTGVMPHASHSYSNSTLATLLGGIDPNYRNGLGNSGLDALVPAGYTTYQLNDKFWLGLAVNAPFGLAVSFPRDWAGAAYGQSAEIKTYNFQPVVAYKFSDMFSIAVGLQAQYMKVSYDALSSAFPLTSASLNGAGWSYGFTLGATFTPWAGTDIGIGYRSAIDQKINGTLTSPTPGSSNGSINTSIALPEMVTVGLRQKLWQNWTLLAGFEWSNWSRIGTSTVFTPAGGIATISGVQVLLPFQYSDGYFYSVGAEYAWDPNLTLRAGIGFEKSPITDRVRTPRLPDNDRVWYSAGLTWKPDFLMKGLSLDIGYSFLDVKDTPVCAGPAALGGCPSNPWSGTTAYVGSVDAHVHIISVGLRYQFGVAPEPVKLITKG